MAKRVFEKFDRNEITEAMLGEAADLFNQNYGTWGKFLPNSKRAPKQGSRVRLSKDRLRAQCLPGHVDCRYVKVTVEGHLAGNAFACYWKFNDKSVCWISQLVVHHRYREQGLAFGLLTFLRQEEVTIYGLMSSHPAACLAAAKAFGNGINSLPLDFIKGNAEDILKESPIDYVKHAKLRGSLFDSSDTSGMVSSVYTSFFVDHTEPLAALAWTREGSGWPLGELLDGHEFLFICERRRRSRSRTWSAAQLKA